MRDGGRGRGAGPSPLPPAHLTPALAKTSPVAWVLVSSPGADLPPVSCSTCQRCFAKPAGVGPEPRSLLGDLSSGKGVMTLIIQNSSEPQQPRWGRQPVRVTALGPGDDALSPTLSAGPVCTPAARASDVSSLLLPELTFFVVLKSLAFLTQKAFVLGLQPKPNYSRGGRGCSCALFNETEWLSFTELEFTGRA